MSCFPITGRCWWNSRSRPRAWSQSPIFPGPRRRRSSGWRRFETEGGAGGARGFQRGFPADLACEQLADGEAEPAAPGAAAATRLEEMSPQRLGNAGALVGNDEGHETVAD